jgi:hypothetical protein
LDDVASSVHESLPQAELQACDEASFSALSFTQGLTLVHISAQLEPFMLLTG